MTMLAAPSFSRAQLGLVAAALAVASASTAILTAPRAGPDVACADALTVVGSRALRTPIEDWLALYRRRHPDSRAHSAMYGTGLAASAMAERRADVAPMARAMIAEERSLLGGTGAPMPVTVGFRLLPGSGPTPFYLYIARDDAGRVDMAGLNFALVAVSEQGQAALDGNDYASLPPAQREQARVMLASLAGGPDDNSGGAGQ